MQDVFLQAFRRWAQFDGRSAPSTWLYTIAARRCQRRHRRKSGEPRHMVSLSAGPGEADVQVASASNPFDEAASRQMESRVAAAIAALPPTLRLPMVLAEIAEMPLADVAAVLGLKLGTVKSRLHRARIEVRQRVAAARPTSGSDHERKFCVDLLQAKQEALDRGVPFPVHEGDLCEHCRGLFASLDLTRDVCRRLAAGDIPSEVADFTRASLHRMPAPARAGSAPARTSRTQRTAR